jgi:hypothetical protein
MTPHCKLLVTRVMSLWSALVLSHTRSWPTPLLTCCPCLCAVVLGLGLGILTQNPNYILCLLVLEGCRYGLRHPSAKPHLWLCLAPLLPQVPDGQQLEGAAGAHGAAAGRQAGPAAGRLG